VSTREAAPDRKTMLRTIERAGGMRGLVLMLRDQMVTDEDGMAPDAARVVATIDAAWAATDGDKARHAHVAQMTAAIAKNASDRSGPVQVSRTAWLLLKSYAFTGRVPEKQT
jgi:hypothetical protein